MVDIWLWWGPMGELRRRIPGETLALACFDFSGESELPLAYMYFPFLPSGSYASSEGDLRDRLVLTLG